MMRDLQEILTELDQKADRYDNVPLPGDDLISRYQDEIGLKFRPEYIEFIKRFNNADVGSKEILILTENGEAWPELRVGIDDARKLGVPSDWLPICMDNSDSYCLTPNGEIRFWSHNGPTNEKWDSLAAWIKDVWIDEG